MHPRLLLVALQLLTRLPVGDPWREPRDTARSVGWFGVAGALVGGVAACTWWIASLALPPTAAAVLAVAATLLLTGGLHEDGAADSADGLFGGHDPDRRLAIMRDSTLGTYGVLAIVVPLLLKVALLASLAPAAGAAALVAVGALGRGAAGVGLLGAVPAAADGRGAALLDHLSPGPGVGGAVTAGLIAAALLGPIAVAPIAVALAAAGGVRAWAVRRLGGLTGDVMGAMIVAAELSALLVVVALTG